MIWALIIYIGSSTILEYPIFQDAETCVQALTELREEGSDLVMACAPYGIEV